MSKQTILAKFTDPDECLHAAEKLVARGVKIREVYSPFPIHGIDPVLGKEKTRISTAAFFYGVLGTTLALLMMWYMNVHDWAMNIGGKPSFSLATNLPAFIPVAFEITVLIAAHGMIGTYFFRTRLFPGLAGKNPDKRSTDDLFVMEIVHDDNPGIQVATLKEELNEMGAVECVDDELRYIDEA
jgi:hypothetical protein